MSGQFLHNLLSVSPVLNPLKHAGQNLSRIRDTLLLADLGAAGIQISSSHAQVMGCHLKSTPGSGTGLFKNQNHILPF